MTINDILRDIASKNGGILTAETVVDEAKDASHPLHSRFTWDDTEAARRYRIEEARHLIKSVKVTYETRPNNPVAVRAFHCVSQVEDSDSDISPDSGKANVFVTIETAMSSDDYRRQINENAKQELIAFKRKYNNLIAVESLFESIDSAIELLS